MKEQKHDIMDRGWAGMQRILDQEMPRRRRRVAGWWWLTGLLLLPIMGLAGWQWYQRAPQTIPAPTIPTAPVAQHAPVNAASTNADPAIQSSKGAAESTTSAKVQNWNGPAAIRLMSPAAPTETRVFLTEKEGIAGPERSTASALKGMIPASGIAPIPAQPAAPSVSALGALPRLFPLLNAEMDTVDLPTYPAYTSTEITRKATHRATWALGVVGGITSERLPRINGGMAGLVTDWQPLRHWGLRSGLQYAMQRLAADESLVTTISEDAYERTSNGLGLLDNSGNYGDITQFPSINTNILASVRRIHRIETPLLVYWQPVRALRAYAGASLNYTFLAQTSPRIFADNQVYKVATGRDELNRLATEKLDRWQVKWQLGFGYRIGRWAEVNAGIQATLPKITLQKDDHFTSELQTASRQNISVEQVRQMAITLRGVVFF